MMQMKPIFWVAGALSLAVLGGCGGGLNPSPDTNGPATVGARLSSSDFYDSTTGRYYDIFVYDALYSGQARVQMRSGEFDTQLYVYEKDSDGVYSLIAKNNDADSSTTDSDCRFDVTQGRTYRILTTSSGSDGLGAYEARFSSNLSTPTQVTTQAALASRSGAKFALPPMSK